MKAYAVVMAGGRGTRFWPLSRRHRAKQFFRVTSGGTLIQETVHRIQPLIPRERVFVILGEDQVEEAVRQLPDVPRANFIVEPVGRNTAPAIGLASLVLSELDPQAVMVVLPSDHLIANDEEFRRVLEAAIGVASKSEVLVVMGIRPTHPETGYGYICPGDEWVLEAGERFQRVVRFIEKPSRDKAESYVEQGCLWNSGMFVWRVSKIRSEIACHLPALDRALTEVGRVSAGSTREELLREFYPRLEAVSIDYGVMEASDAAVVVPCEFGWNDVGSWSALASVWDRDQSGNAIRGKAVTLDSRGCIVASRDRLVALVDMQDVIVVDTPDAVLVCPASSDQRIRDLVRLLETSSLDRYL